MPNWSSIINQEIQKDYYKNIVKTIDEDKKSFNVFPNEKDIFNAFKYCKFDTTKVVILGQDPYHGEGQAHGLSFSVLPGTNIPPSLKNIFKEINSDLNICINNGCLINWASQGVLLLNSYLTVIEGKPLSHSKIGWNVFTDKMLSELNNENRPIVFMLWGAASRSKKELLNNNNHLILETSHPSPLSAWNGFLGCKHFSKANEFLIKNNLTPINWEV